MVSAGRVLGAGLLVTVLFSGCALLRPDEAKKAPEDSPPVPAVRLVVNAPSPLNSLLAQHLDLARVQALPAGDALSLSEWSRLIASAPAQARSILETEGYFEAQVTVTRKGDFALPAATAAAPASAPGSAAASATASTAPPTAEPPAAPTASDGQALPELLVTVVPGPRVRVTQLQVRASGPIAARAEAGDDDAKALQQRLPQVPVLQPGQPFRNPGWSSSKQQVVAALRIGGYAAATLDDAVADVDVPQRSAQLRITANSGPLFLAGPMVVSGLKFHDEQTVRNLANFGPGAALTEARIQAFQDRLQKVGLFQSANVNYDPDVTVADAAPIRVRLSELPLQQATVGVGVTANTGPRVTLEHLHRRPFGWAVVAKNQLEWGRNKQSYTGDFQTHPGENFYRKVLGTQIERVVGSNDVVLSQRLRVGLAQSADRIERLYFLELLRSRQNTFNSLSADPVTSALALTANAHLNWRDLDSDLLPTRGLSVVLQSAIGQATSGDGADGPLARLYGRVTGYLPLGSWYGQARMEAGQVFKRDNVVSPDTLGFRAGGDESVRGYTYRSISPVNGNGDPVSGTKLFTASVELARPIMPSLPILWGAVFADAGWAADTWQGFKPTYGYGVGVRLRSPIGPLKVDLARAHTTGKFKLHLSVGVTF